MTIGFDGSRAFNKDKTGTENYSYQLLKHLAKIDTENYYNAVKEPRLSGTYKVYIRPSAVIAKQEAGSLIPSKEGIQPESLSPGSPIRSGLTIGGSPDRDWPGNFQFIEINIPRFWTQIGLSKQTFKDNLDILFVPSHTLPIIRNPKLKTVITVHDLGAEYLPKMHQLKQQLYLKYMTHRQLKGATKIIAVSKATKDDLIKRVKIDPKKIEVIYEGVDRGMFKQVKNDALVNSLRHYNLEPRSYFLFVGTIQPRKNLERLIRAFSLYISPGPATAVSSRPSSLRFTTLRARRDETSSASPLEMKLVLVGGKGWLSEEIYSLPEKLGIKDKVKFLGHVANEDLPALYSGAIALVFPSLFEGFGLPILEAMSCGTPVITSKVSSMPEVAGEAAILVDPLKVEEITEAMSKLAEDTKLRDNLIQKGYKQVERFSWEKAAKETLQLFKNL